MKKLFGFLIILAVIGLVAWGGVTWFIGKQTESMLKQKIEEQNALGNNNIELVDYKNTSFFDAQATSKVTTGIALVDEILADANVITNVKHGPVIFSDSGIKFGASYSESKVDLDSLSEQAAALVSEFFGDKNPVNITTLIGYDQNLTYSIKVPAFSQDGEASFAIDGINMDGKLTLKDRKGPATLSVGEMHLKDTGMEVIVPEVKADIDVQGFAASHMLGTAKVAAPGIKIKSPQNNGDIAFDLSMNSDTRQIGDAIDGDMGMQASNVSEPTNTIKQAEYSANYQGLSIAGLTEFNHLQTEFNNMQNQLMWNMENTQTPEGQEKMMALITKAQRITQQMIKVFFEKILIASKSQMTQSLNLSGDKGSSSLDAEFVYTGSGDTQAIDVDKMMLGDMTDLLKVIAGTVDIDLDKAMLPEDVAPLLQIATLQGIAQDEDKKYRMSATMTDGEVTLNGETMSFEDFIAKFNPEIPSIDAESDLALPPDIEQRIREEGITADVLEAIEASDDVDPAVAKHLKELQHLMESVDAIPPELPPEVLNQQ